jgi:hypothetical protein
MWFVNAYFDGSASTNVDFEMEPVRFLGLSKIMFPFCVFFKFWDVFNVFTGNDRCVDVVYNVICKMPEE